MILKIYFQSSNIQHCATCNGFGVLDSGARFGAVVSSSPELRVR